MLRPVLTILSTNFGLALLTMLAGFLVRSYADLSLQREFFALFIYSAFLVPFIEFGLSTYFPANNNLKKRYFLYIFVFSSIIIGTVWYLKIIDNELLLAFSLIILINRMFATIAHTHCDWYGMQMTILMPAIARLLSVLACIYFEAEQFIPIGIVLATTITLAFLPLFYKHQEEITAERPFSIKDIFFHYAISIVIIMAMRLDQVASEVLFGPSFFVEVAILFQFTQIFPLLTNAILTYEITNKNIQAFDEHFALKILSTLIFGGFFWLFVEFLVTPLYALTHSDAKLYMSLVAAAGFGGILFTKYEAQYYKNGTRHLLTLKISQLLIIVMGVVVSGIIENPIFMGVGIYLSRLYAWTWLLRKTNAHS